jgi:SAM-dependent methyltransferase
MINKFKILSSPPTGKYFPFEWYELAKDNHFWCKWRFQVLLRQFQDLGILRSTPLKGLEVGCGNGVVLQQIEHSTNWTIDGVDLSEKALSLVNITRGETFLYDIHDRHPDFKENYDFLILFDVLEHINDPKPFLTSLLYHLKPSGWLFVNVPALTLLFSNYDLAAQHLKRYDKKMMRHELACDILEIQDMRYWGLALVPLLIIRKLLLSRNTIPSQVIIEKGFKVQSDWMNNWFLRIMRIETALLKKPILGTSLMTAAVKLAK